MQKKYFKQSIKNWLHWHLNLDDKHLSLRLAGNPSFLIEKYESKYWVEEWQNKYRELLIMLKEIWDDNKSPFVLYINELL
jgi:hypothetical protein